MSRNIIPISLLLLMCACGGSDNRVPAASAPDSSYDRERVLNVYSWADYIAPDTVPNFEKETGIKVRYDTYDNNELLETKLLTGHTNYDVVIPTENFFDRQMRAGVYRKLDKQALTNLGNADPEIMRRLAVHDPGNLYAVPYMWASTGLAYNVNRVKERLGSAISDSWALLFDPANARKLQDCGIAITDSPLEIFQSAMIYLGRDPNRHDPADIGAAAELLRKIRPFVGRIEPDLIAPVASGDVCLALSWSGDMEIARNRAIEASRSVQIAYFVPREGALVAVDMMAIPADAPHPRNAEAWMNYLLRPEVIAAISNYIKYPNGNRASLPYLDAAIKADPAIYPDADTRARLITNSAVSSDYSRLVTREWTRFRTAQ